MLRRAVVGLTRSFGSGAQIQARVFNTSTVVNAKSNNNFGGESLVNRLTRFIQSDDVRSDLFRKLDEDVLHEALSQTWSIHRSKFPYVANNISSYEIPYLKFAPATKFILSVLKQNEGLIEKYMSSTELFEKFAVLDFLIGYCGFSENYSYLEFLEKLKNRSNIEGATVLALLDYILDEQKLPSLKGHDNLKALLAAGVDSGHIKNLPKSTLIEVRAYLNKKPAKAEVLASNIKAVGADAFLAKLSVTESNAKPKRNSRDAETSLSNGKPSKETELELMKDCIKGLKELLYDIEDDHYWHR